MDDDRKRIFKTINYMFKDEKILKEALSPPDSNKEVSGNAMIEFKRLKWLGDSILDMVVTDILYKTFPDDSEEDLSNKKYHLVAADALLKVAENIGISEFIYYNRKVRSSPSSRSLSNAIEAVIGAIYIDGGLEKVTSFINHFWESQVRNIINNPRVAKLHPKSYLKLWSDKNKLPLPKYKVVETTGNDSSPTYKVQATLENIGEAFGTGNTIREAEKQAAKVLYDRLCENEKITNREDVENGDCIVS